MCGPANTENGSYCAVTHEELEGSYICLLLQYCCFMLMYSGNIDDSAFYSQSCITWKPFIIFAGHGSQTPHGGDQM